MWLLSSNFLFLLFFSFFSLYSLQSLEKLSKQQLSDGDVVLVLDKFYAGRRAVILNTRGVPGLDKIRYLFRIIFILNWIVTILFTCQNKSMFGV